VFSGRIRFTLPAGYLTYFESEDQTRAMSADRNMILVTRHENYKGGDLDFWTKLIRRALAEQKAMTVKSVTDLALKTHAPARLISTTKEIGGKQMEYLVAIATDRQNVYTFEAWGSRETFPADRSKIETAICSLEIRP